MTGLGKITLEQRVPEKKMYRFYAGYNQSMQIYIQGTAIFSPAIDSLDDYHRARTFPIWL